MIRLFRPFAVAAFLVLPSVAPAGAPLQPRNDTGQTQCSDMEGVEVDCSAPLLPFQDGRIGRDAAAGAGLVPKVGGGTGGFDFTKIANDGTELPAEAQIGNAPGDWACTRDNTTGLVWEIKRLAGERSYQWAYHWYDPNPETNGGFEGMPGGLEPICGFLMQCDTKTYIDYVNSIALCGRSDWRLPGVEELFNIVNYGSSFFGGGAMDRVYFADEGGYSGFGGAWTGSTAHEPPDGQAVWMINFDDGSVQQGPKGAMMPVRAVTGEAAPRSDGEEPVCGKRMNPQIPPSTAGAFSFDGKGTATDVRTGLSWDRCAIGQDFVDDGDQARCDGETRHLNWQEAMEEVRARNEQNWRGHDDWRLPNVKELRSIFEARCFGPVVDLRVFPERGEPYWTSTSYDWEPTRAWAYEFFGGNSSPTSKNDSWPGLRLVRGGTPFDAYEGGLSHSIGGAVTGMVGSGLVLRLTVNGGSPETLTRDADGPFTFSSGLSPGDQYDVEVQTPPSPFQACTVAHGSGTVADVDVSDVEVTCDEPDPAIIETAPDSFRFDVAVGADTQATLDVRNAGGGFLHWSIATAYAASARMPDGAIDCAGEPGLIVHDDGSVENAYTGNAAWPAGVVLVDRFTPDAYPASIRALCLALAGAGGVTRLDFEVVVFRDNGANGGPGTELGALPATATGIPTWPVTTPQWFAYDLSSLYTTIDSGSLYVGIRFHPVSPPGVYVVADESADRPAGYAGGQYWNWGDAGAWSPTADHFAEYRSMFFRAVAADAQPLPTGCDDPHAVPWLRASPSAGSTPAGRTDAVTIAAHTAGLAVGDYSALLCLDSDDSAGHGRIEIPVALHVAAPAAVLSVTPAAIAFGEVRLGETSPSQQITIANTGNAPLGGIVPASPSAPFQRSGGSCAAAPFTLAPSQSCTIAYAFAPTALGAQQQDVAIASDAGGATVHLSGTGIPAPAAVLSVTPGSIAFGQVRLGETSPSQQTTIANTGDAPLGGIVPAAPSAPFQRSGGSCAAAPFTLAPSQSCTIAYAFAPTALGVQQQDIAIASDAGSATVHLSGTGVPGAPAAIVAVSGGGQQATVGSPFAQPLVVVVRDAFGNPLSGVPVTFTAPAAGAGATLSATSATTGADGQTSVTASANAVAGSYVVTATTAGVTAPATFALTNLPAEPLDEIFVDGFEMPPPGRTAPTR